MFDYWKVARYRQPLQNFHFVLDWVDFFSGNLSIWIKKSMVSTAVSLLHSFFDFTLEVQQQVEQRQPGASGLYSWESPEWMKKNGRDSTTTDVASNVRIRHV